MDDGFRKPRMTNPKLKWIFPTVLVLVVLSFSYVLVSNSMQKNEPYSVGKISSPVTMTGTCSVSESSDVCTGVSGKECNTDPDCVTNDCKGTCIKK